jgi:hypothetical protein
MNPHTLRHCVYEVTELERLDVRKKMIQFLYPLKFTSDAAIFLHFANKEEIFTQLTKPQHYELRARRLLRGCGSAWRSKYLRNSQLRLAMTSGVVMAL